LAEDFASWAIERFIQGKRLNSSYFGLLTDFKRHEFGDSRRSAKRCDRKTQRYGYETEIPFNQDRKPGNERDSREFNNKIGTLKIFDRVIAMLALWGFSEVEISYCFDVSESRISQRIKRISECLSKGIKEPSEEQAKRKRKVEEVLQEKEIDRSDLEQFQNSLLAEEESGEVESDFEVEFSEWLT